MGAFHKDSFCQVSIVVKDIEAMSKRYAEMFGIPEPTIFETPTPEIAKTVYRGKPTDARAKLAVFELGPIILDLIQPSDEPSSWKEFLETHGEGVHHIAFQTENREEVVQYFEQHDMPVRHYGEYAGGNYTVFDSEAQLGLLIQAKYESIK